MKPSELLKELMEFASDLDRIAKLKAENLELHSRVVELEHQVDVLEHWRKQHGYPERITLFQEMALEKFLEETFG